MRGQQLSVIARERLGQDGSVDYIPIGAVPRNQRIFLTKGALKSSEPSYLEKLKKAGNRLLFDPVDEPVIGPLLPFADVIIAASVSAMRSYRRMFPDHEVVLVNHHVDPRIDELDPRPAMTSPRIGYFGLTVNAVLNPSVEALVTVVPVDTEAQDPKWMARLDEFTAHYAVRLTRDLDEFKPFLKGFTAARCGANIIIQRSETEAVEWLGPDYPYLFDYDGSDQSILDTIGRAAEDFGGPEWDRGLDVMRGIRMQTSRSRIGREVVRAMY